MTMYQKNDIPFSLLEEKSVSPVVKLYFEFNHLKQLFRQGWIKNLGAHREVVESVAEHEWAMSLLGYFIADEYFPELDKNKILIMILLHEFGEIYLGDLILQAEGEHKHVHDNISDEDKHIQEIEIVKKIFNDIPNGKKYIDIYLEFDERKTPEAQFVYQLDRLEMAFQGCIYELQGYGDAEGFFESTRKRLTDPKLIQIFNELLALRKPSHKHS